LLEVRGPEAVAYLDAHLTVVVADLLPGDAKLGALLAPKGTLLGLLRITRVPDGFQLHGGPPAIAAALERGKIGWMVELVPIPEAPCTTLSDLERVEAGLPAFGRDVDERTLPHEAGLVPDVVALDKGIYPGKMTVLRQARSGTIHRTLRRLVLDAPVAEGSEVHDDEGPLGRVGTVVVSPTRGPLALALLRRRAEPGSRVRVGDVSGIVEP
jgi:folate-binding Fe-S cluster repair protein YgfZ